LSVSAGFVTFRFWRLATVVPSPGLLGFQTVDFDRFLFMVV
jgi:hypothetical protein